MPDPVLVLTLAHRLQQSAQVMFQDVGGEAVLLDLASETYFGLNEVGTRVWILLPEAASLASVLATLCDEFDAPAAIIEHDLLVLATQLSEAGLVTVTE